MPQPFPWLQSHEVPYVFPVKTPVAAEHAPDEGALALDVYETDREIVITAPIAGVNPEDLDVALTHDLVTIRGERKPAHHDPAGRFMSQECHWGKFSRTVILPEHIKTDEAEAVFINGVLTVRLPKNPNAGHVPIQTVNLES